MCVMHTHPFFFLSKVHQLRQQAQLERQSVSCSVSEMVNFCQSAKKMDALVNGFKSQKQNPYKEETGCLFI